MVLASSSVVSRTLVGSDSLPCSNDAAAVGDNGGVGELGRRPGRKGIGATLALARADSAPTTSKLHGYRISEIWSETRTADGSLDRRNLAPDTGGLCRALRFYTLQTRDTLSTGHGRIRSRIVYSPGGGPAFLAARLATGPSWPRPPGRQASHRALRGLGAHGLYPGQAR
ncbi:hypothetical protein [Streptomyces lydicus]|uniref:hypothetical protein n=1 Tax=Streptomyces lydicus TaxID=47763 RepID=UPI001011591C|nr:hypothetical protein [Streptomyces lydicus]MCZ1012076.1 hypothetical protein [Streptomyces lydicus]